jgi:xylulokinase
MTLFLGIDIGTSAVKALVVDERQEVLAEADQPLTLSRPRPLWSEQNPLDWWAAVRAAAGELREKLGTRWPEVAAIGLSGQMHGAVLLDQGYAPLLPAILWNDGRATAEAAWLNAGIADFADTVGVPAMPGLLLPKLLWVRKHQPDVYRRVRHVMLPKDFVRLQLTGSCATDLADAAGTLLLDEARRDWWPPALAAADLTPEQLPALHEGCAVSGDLCAAAAAELGLRAGIPVAAGAGDAAAGGIGIGAVDDGAAFVALGTSSQMFVTRARYAANPAGMIHSFAHAVPQRWFQMAAMLNGASCLAWHAGAMQAPIPTLLEEAEAARRLTSPVIFLPYLMGERTPHNDAFARAVFFGMDGGTDRAALTQAVLEGVAFSLMDGLAALAGCGPLPERFAVIGGGSRNAFWVQLIASALGRPLDILKGGAKGPAFGAARLARLALTGEPVAAVCTVPETAARCEPDPARSAALAERHALYRDLYQTLRPLFPRL